MRFAALLCLFLAGCSPDYGTTGHIRNVTSAVTDSRLDHADQNHSDWLSYGRNYAEDRFSDIHLINAENIDALGLAWTYNLGPQRGIEATPLVVDGIMYISGPWSVVWALDARTGQMIWEWDPAVDRKYAGYACCDVVNRGLALYDGKIYVGVLDGRLVALDAATGHPVWSKLTVDQSKRYTITGAPRVVNGKVIIGNGGAEYGVRGYVSAYDAKWGNLVWRTYTVPGDPSLPFESQALEGAAATWSGDWWQYGGGGTAWDAMAFDHELDLLYVGTGNGAPWSRLHRSAGEGDNLYLSSILALNAENGELAWHYQTTPGDTWDYTATQHLLLADIEIDGELRKVIMQAPKNGFFYVIDRTNGNFISAEPYVEVTWAEGIDAMGRPVVPPGNFFEEAAADIAPSPYGGHNWQPMAFNPNTGLVYIPIREHKIRISQNPNWTFQAGAWNTGTRSRDLTDPTGFLLAWDPVRQQEAWRIPLAHHWNGGALTTSGNLVFQGNGEGNLVAYNATSGEVLLEKFLGTGTIGAPITYTMNGKQYVTIVSGWGGAGGLTSPPAGDAVGLAQNGRIFTFALGGEAEMPVFAELPEITAPPITTEASAQEIMAAGRIYNANCARCHGWFAIANTGVPDLRRASAEVHEQFQSIVYGARIMQGMPDFTGVLTPEEVDTIHQYVITQAHAAAR